MIYSNRKEIELKNANQTNVHKINNINMVFYNLKVNFQMEKKTEKEKNTGVMVLLNLKVSIKMEKDGLEKDMIKKKIFFMKLEIKMD